MPPVGRRGCGLGSERLDIRPNARLDCAGDGTTLILLQLFPDCSLHELAGLIRDCQGVFVQIVRFGGWDTEEEADYGSKPRYANTDIIHRASQNSGESGNITQLRKSDDMVYGIPGLSSWTSS